MGSDLDTVQPCDTTQVRLESDFGIKNVTVRFIETVIIIDPTIGSR